MNLYIPQHLVRSTHEVNKLKNSLSNNISKMRNMSSHFEQLKEQNPDLYMANPELQKRFSDLNDALENMIQVYEKLVKQV